MLKNLGCSSTLLCFANAYLPPLQQQQQQQQHKREIKCGKYSTKQKRTCIGPAHLLQDKTSAKRDWGWGGFKRPGYKAGAHSLSFAPHACPLPPPLRLQPHFVPRMGLWVTRFCSIERKLFRLPQLSTDCIPSETLMLLQLLLRQRQINDENDVNFWCHLTKNKSK